MKVYIAGPMRGFDRYNFPAFDDAARRLRWAGCDVISPAEMDRQLGLDETQPLPAWFTVPDAMRRDLRAITECDGIVLLPGWEASEGVGHELAAAKACGVSVMLYDPDAPASSMLTHAPAPTWTPVVDAVADDADGYCRACDARSLDDDDYTPVIGPTGEVRLVDPETGGMKGAKPARFSLIPWDVVGELAEHYGKGGKKYGDHNWRRGYAWSLNHDALHRHLAAWWLGEDDDPETGSSHLLAVAWHAFTLRWFQRHGKGTDDRPTKVVAGHDTRCAP